MDIIHNVPSFRKIDPYGRAFDVNVVAGASTVPVRAVAGDTIDFYFPDGFIDLSTLSMFFKYYLLPYTTPKGGTAQALPKDAETMIQTLEVYLGGKRVNHITNYNQIFNIMSLYGWDAEFRTNRDNYQNVWNNGRTSSATDLDGVQFCCERWLGLLGLPIVLDTRTWGSLHIKITLSPANISTSNHSSHSWGVSDLFMRVKYYENYDGDLPTYLEFDEFKSILTREPSYTQKTNLIVNSSRIDYAIARCLRLDAYQKASGLASLTGNTIYFGTVANQIDNWNISVNNNNIFKYKPSVADGVKTVLDMMESRSVNAPFILTSGAMAYERMWVCGAPLGFVNEVPQQVEIGFMTEGIVGAPVVCFPFLAVKTTSSLEKTKDGQIIHLV